MAVGVDGAGRAHPLLESRRGARAARRDGRPRPGPRPHTIVLVTAQMADMTVVLGNGDALLELVTYLDTNTELARSELHWPGTNFPP